MIYSRGVYVSTPPAFKRLVPRPPAARAAYEVLLERLRQSGVPVEAGVFQAHMDVELVNDGRVTLIIEK